METKVITRNEVAKELASFDIVKGKKVGKSYLAPKWTLEELEAAIKWVGETNVINVLNKFAKVRFQDIWFNSYNEDGSFNDPKFEADAVEFTASGMKLAEIEELIDEATGEQQLLIRTAPVNPETYEFLNIEDRKRVRELADRLTALRAQKDERSRKGKKDEDADPAVPSTP